MHCLLKISEECSKSEEVSAIDNIGEASRSGRKMATYYEKNCDTAYGKVLYGTKRFIP